MAFGPAQLGSLTGTTAVVTGGNSGIGWHTSLELARHGAAVTLACRDTTKAALAADRIRALAPGSTVLVRQLDLASLQSIRNFCQEFHQPLDLLVNNGGVMAPRTWRATEDGFELQFGTNHLGHYALTGRLLPSLLAAARPRVVTVSSIAHRSGTAGVLLGNPAHGYRARQAYAESKLANVLFGLELQRQASSAGSGLASTLAHPGIAATNLFLTKEGLGQNPLIRVSGGVLGRLVLRSAAAGANPTLFAASAAGPGSYSGPQWFGETRGPVGPAAISRSGLDGGLASQLWDLSQDLTGVSYAWP